MTSQVSQKVVLSEPLTVFSIDAQEQPSNDIGSGIACHGHAQGAAVGAEPVGRSRQHNPWSSYTVARLVVPWNMGIQTDWVYKSIDIYIYKKKNL